MFDSSLTIKHCNQYHNDASNQSKQVGSSDYKYSFDTNDMDFDINSLDDRVMLSY